MVKRNEVIDWHKYFTYKDGKLFHKHREGKDRYTKMWNTRYSGTEAGHICSNGYRSLMIKTDMYSKRYYVHRIIWEMFNGLIPDGFQIDHINFDRSDNRIENLQLITRKQNLNRRNQTSKGYLLRQDCFTRPYQASRTLKHFGTPCGAYMSYATAFLQGEENGDNR